MLIVCLVCISNVPITTWAQSNVPVEKLSVGRGIIKETHETYPILIKGTLPEPITTNFQAVRTEKGLFFPIDAIRRTSQYQIITTKTGETSVLVPHMELRGTQLYVDDNAKGSLIPIPLESIDYALMVNSRNVTIGMGVQWKLDKGKIVMAPVYGAIPERKKQEIKTPLYWIFDPFPATGVAYTKETVKGGTNIISPTQFELDVNGVKVKNSPKNLYIENYERENFHVWPLITNQFNPQMTSTILSEPEKWSNYSDALVGYALIYGYDGYNFDFENINVTDKEKLVRFVAYLSKQLKAVGVYTSMDVTGYSTSPNWSLVYDRKALSEHVDYLVLMAYDEVWAKSENAGPVASFPWVKKNVLQLLKEVPAEKVVLGIPFYARLWEEDGRVKPKPRAKSTTISMDDMLRYKNRYPKNLSWNDTLKLNYLQYTEGDSTFKIWMEDEYSLQYKLRLIHDEKLAGFAAWRKGFENIAIWQMISDANHELQLTKNKQ